jgi:hypothetical protein
MGSPKGLMGKVLNKMYGEPSVYTPPAVPEPVAIPTVPTETGESEYKRQMRKSGRAKTVITGDLEPLTKGKKTLLGG